MGLKQTGQAAIEYVAAIAMTIFFVAFLVAQIDSPIRRWWDRLGQKVAAPCPSEDCVQAAPPGSSL